MSIYTIGSIQFSRSTRPIDFDQIAHIFPIAGKDVVRIAWGGLNAEQGWILKEHLEAWFRQFFNLKNSEDGSACVDSLVSMGLLRVEMDNKRHVFYKVWPTFSEV